MPNITLLHSAINFLCYTYTLLYTFLDSLSISWPNFVIKIPSGWADHLEASFIERTPIRVSSHPSGALLTLSQPVRADVQRLSGSLQAPPRRWPLEDLCMPHEGQLHPENLPTSVSRNSHDASHFYSDFRFYKHFTYVTSKVNFSLVYWHIWKINLSLDHSLYAKSNKYRRN